MCTCSQHTRRHHTVDAGIDSVLVNVLMYGTVLVDITIFSQKIFSNCYISDEPIRRGLLHSAKALWNAFLVRGLGLIPLNGGSRLKFAGAHGAFELLRVRNPSLDALCPPSSHNIQTGAQPICSAEPTGWIPRHELKNSSGIQKRSEHGPSPVLPCVC